MERNLIPPSIEVAAMQVMKCKKGKSRRVPKTMSGSTPLRNISAVLCSNTQQQQQQWGNECPTSLQHQGVQEFRLLM
jgi:hypothetical protein